MFEVNNLSCGYKGNNTYSAPQALLCDVNFKLPEGEILALLGPNGAGKSTLLKTLFGLIEPLTGQITFHKSDPIHKIAMLETEPQSAFFLPVHELLSMGSDLNSQLTQNAIECLEVGSLLDKNIQELSSGQAKRVWLAHILSLPREIILIDEPFLHLDWAFQRKLNRTLKEWANNHKRIIIFAAHELDQVINTADKAILIDGGRVKTQGNVEDVLTARETSEVFAFHVQVDQNPIDGTKRLTIGNKK